MGTKSRRPSRQWLRHLVRYNATMKAYTLTVRMGKAHGPYMAVGARYASKAPLVPQCLITVINRGKRHALPPASSIFPRKLPDYRASCMIDYVTADDDIIGDDVG